MFRYIALLVVSIGCYIAAFTLSGILFIWFNPGGYDCGLNVFFLSMSMILAFVFAIVALHPKVMNRNASKQLKLYLYSMFLCNMSCLVMRDHAPFLEFSVTIFLCFNMWKYKLDWNS